MSDKTVEELVKESTQKGTFKFVDALKNRSHPTDTVDVYLDEAAAYPLIDLQAKLERLDKRLDGIDPTAEDAGDYAKQLDAERKEIKARMAEIAAEIRKSKYVFHVRGVTQGYSEDALAKARADYPLEYDEYTNPITGAKSKEPISNPDRDRLYTNLLWQGHIVKIVDPEGNEEISPDLETVAAIRREAPVAAVYDLEQAMNKVDMAVDWQKLVVDEGFLPKS